MKTYIISYILIGLSILCLSCENKKQQPEINGKKINIDIANANALKYDSYYKKSRLIPLETLSNSLIGEISKLYFTDSHILIFDKKSMNIMLFDINGKFKRQIGKKGGGPDEYVSFNDIQFDKKASLIYAHERFQNSIFTYNLSGELINKSPRIPLNFNSFYKTDAGCWIYSCFKKNNSNGYNLTLLNENLSEVKASYFPQKEFVNISNFSTFTTDNDDNLYFYYPSSNIIYILKENQFIPFCSINFGSKTMPYANIREINDFKEYDNLVADRKYLGDITDLIICNDVLYFSFRETGFGISTKAYSCYYNFSTNDIVVIAKPFIEGLKYPVASKLIGAANGVHIFQLDLSLCTEDSFSYLTELLSTPISFDSNTILAVFDLNQ